MADRRKLSSHALISPCETQALSEAGLSMKTSLICLQTGFLTLSVFRASVILDL